MGEHIRKLLTNWMVSRHLKAIEKEIKKHDRMRRKIKRQAALVHLMVNRFNELFPDYKLTIKDGGADG